MHEIGKQKKTGGSTGKMKKPRGTGAQQEMNRLPIEDQYLEDPRAGGGARASVVGPTVASSATKSAMEEFAKIPSAIRDSHMNLTAEVMDLEAPEAVDLKKSRIAGKEKEEEGKDDEKDKKKDKEVHDESEEKQKKTKTKKDKKEEKDEESKKPDTVQECLIKDAQLQSSASAALASAAVKAKHLAGVEEKKIKSLMGQNQEMTGAAPGNIVMNNPRVPGVKQGMNRSQTQQSQASEEEKEEVEEEETFDEDFYSLFTY